MTLRVLYRLYGEAEEERDFFSSTTATSVYETFLLKVVSIHTLFYFLSSYHPKVIYRGKVTS